MIISNKLYINRDYKYYKEIFDYCQKNLILDNPEYLQKLKMNKFIGSTPKKLRYFETNNDTLILPFGCIDDIKKNCWLDSYKLDVHTSEDINWNYDLGLYDYQKQSSEKMVKAKHGILIAPAGSGKTQSFIDIILKLKKKALILVHTIDLLKQAKDRIERLTDIKVGTISSGKVDIKDITIAVVQTLSKMDLSQYAYEWGTIVIDEAHRILNAGVTRQAMFSKILGSLKCLNKIGVTATFHRATENVKTINFLVGDIAHEVSKEAVADKIIKPIIKPIHIEKELSRNCLDTDGTIIFTKAISEIAMDEKRNKKIAEMIKQCKEESCLVLSDRLDQLRILKEMVGYGVMIDGSMTSKKGKQERERAIEDMRSGKEKVLYGSVNLCKEGLDIQRLERAFLCTPKKDYAILVQVVGRVARAIEGKKTPIVYDFVDSNWLCKNMWQARKKIYKKEGYAIIE